MRSLRPSIGELLVEEGALYPALYRMEAKGWIEAEWGLSTNNRRAKYYSLYRKGATTSNGKRRHGAATPVPWESCSPRLGRKDRHRERPADYDPLRPFGVRDG
jgi:DNA-binding PadR family transcriptional regulator